MVAYLKTQVYPEMNVILMRLALQKGDPNNNIDCSHDSSWHDECVP